MKVKVIVNGSVMEMDADQAKSMNLTPIPEPPTTSTRVDVPVGTQLSKEQRKKIRDANQAESMRIPEQFCQDGLSKDGKIVGFPAKKSRRTGNIFAACQLEVDGVRFCVLDQDPDKYDVGMSVKITFEKTDNPDIQSGFVCTYQ